MKTSKFLLALFFSLPAFIMAQEKQALDELLTSWHNAAAVADQEAFFDLIDDNGIYIGTDSTEIWTKEAFYEWATPHFEKQKTWNFIATHRDIYFSDTGNIAWFDELIDYGSGTLRGSGVLQKRGSDWKIMQYVLSVPVPNEKFKAVMSVIQNDP